MPITEAMADILDGGLSADAALERLMSRKVRKE